jgi:hypothetical protein
VPIYHYQCTHCQATEGRIGGVDDHLAICARCHHLMLRLDYDLLAPYFEASASPVRPSALGARARAKKITDWEKKTCGRR